MDILDEFPKEEKNMEEDKVKELLGLMRAVQRRSVSPQEYWEKLGNFWNDNGFPEWAEECYAKLKA